MTARCRGTGNDGKSYTNSKAPTDLKGTAVGCGIGLGGVDGEGSDACYAGEACALSVSRPSNTLHGTLTHRKRLL